MPAVDKLLLEEALQDSPQVAAAPGDSPALRPSLGRRDAPERSVSAGSPWVWPGRCGLTAGEGRGAASRGGERGAGGGAGGQGAAARRAGKWVRVSSALGAVGERGAPRWAHGTRGIFGVPRGIRRGKSRQSLGVSWEEGCPPARGVLRPFSSPPSEKLLWRFSRTVPLGCALGGCKGCPEQPRSAGEGQVGRARGAGFPRRERDTCAR